MKTLGILNKIVLLCSSIILFNLSACSTAKQMDSSPADDSAIIESIPHSVPESEGGIVGSGHRIDCVKTTKNDCIENVK